jgi:hypothetical protein
MKWTDLDPVPDAEWQVWYEDTFDRACPRRIDASGRGLVRGLAELWARHLCETVQADGSRGFSRFNLWWAPRSIQIAGDWQGAARLRHWVFGEQTHIRQGYVESGDTDLLRQLAAAHAHLVLAGQSSELILLAAMAAADRPDFKRRLADLASQSE